MVCGTAILYCKGCEKCLDQTSRAWSALRNFYRNLKGQQPIPHPEVTPAATPAQTPAEAPAATPALPQTPEAVSEYLKKNP
ncbi:hypothetical protein Ddc_23741 [Ditylenchus destructor]|nr:hypothetical protein Ddc_23741 [Ditylenchus destructor]